MNLLVTGAWRDAKEYLSEIEGMGHDVKFLQYEKDPLPCEYDWVEGVICNGLFLHHPIERFPKLKYIQLTSAGYDRVPIEYIKRHDIKLYNAKGVYSIPMAEWAIMSALELYKNAYSFFENQQKRLWKKDSSLLELTDKKVCIVGYGNVGREVAKRFSSFGTQILAVNRSKVEDIYIRQWFPLQRMDEALSEADIVIICIALTTETKNLFDRDRINKMKQGSVLVNISRGDVIEEETLMESLCDDKFRGVALDVFAEEPLSEKCALWNDPRVIISPHNSYVGDKVNVRMREVIYSNLKKVEV